MAERCNHTLEWHTNLLLKDGRNPLVIYCTKCARQWDCTSINFANMGETPRYIPDENGRV